MTTDELILLVQHIQQRQFESQNIELKKAKDGVPQSLYNSLSSFSNQKGGGIIVFGVDEKNNYEIVGVGDVQTLQQKVDEQCKQMVPVVRPVFCYAKINDKYVVSCEIGECDIFEKPCYYSGKGKNKGSYIRVGEADNPMTDYEVYSYEVFKRNIKDELREVDAANIEDLNKEKLERFYYEIENKKPNLSKLSHEEILKLMNVIKNGVPTLCGYMLFAKYPQSKFPQFSIIASVVPGEVMGDTGLDGVRFIDDKRIEGTIPEMLDGAIEFIKRNMKNKVSFDNEANRTNTLEYPIKAIREAILNSLVHRDYSINTENCPIQILMFSNRIEITNPGGLYGRTTLDQLGTTSVDVRNPFVATILEVMISSENRYSGIPTICREMKNFGLKDPIFESERGNFKVTLFNENEAEDSFVSQIVEFCRVPRTREEIANKFNVTTVAYFITRYIWPLMAAGKIKETIPDKPRSKNQKYYSV